MEKYIDQALKNIIHFGDTDIFPFPFERLLFEERFEECKEIVLNIHKNFDELIDIKPPLTEIKLNQVGYFGFRNSTQIEPFWNVYYLSLVLSLAEPIEKVRISIPENSVFSYRYEWNSKKSSLFKDISWNDYRLESLKKSKTDNFIVQTDISDFYGRINHHKLQNELDRLAKNTGIPYRIMKLLGVFSGGSSYGLPVGGPASRILAELTLNHSDKHLTSRDIKFCRYADDYTIFCENQTSAYKNLILLAEKLSNEGLSLQKNKTKIVSAKEFVTVHSFLDPQSQSDPLASEEQKLLNVSIRYDPYSPTAEEDYEKLKEAVTTIDIIGILSKEVHKTRIDQTITKQAINSIKVLNSESQLSAIKVLLDPDNLHTLAPVFTTIMRAARGIYFDLPDEGKEAIDSSILHLFKSESYLIKIDLNLNYIVQVIGLKYSHQKEKLLIKIFDTTLDHILKRQIIVILANWDCHYWLSDIRKNFTTFTLWERRAFIYASYFLGDEGNHWRRNNSKSFDDQERLVRDWANKRVTDKTLIMP